MEWIPRAEMHIAFWVSTEERDDAILPGDKGDSTGAGNLIKLRRLSPPVVNRNLSIESSGKVLNGRGCVKVVEPVGLVVSRTYEISWRKKSLDYAELARLRYEEGFGTRKIAEHLGLPRTTVVDAVCRFEKQMGLR